MQRLPQEMDIEMVEYENKASSSLQFDLVEDRSSRQNDGRAEIHVESRTVLKWYHQEVYNVRENLAVESFGVLSALFWMNIF